MGTEKKPLSSEPGDSPYLNFQNPAPKYYPAVYWFWHRVPMVHEIDWQLRKILEAGYRTFLIQPRLAFEMQDYLTKEYFTAYHHAMAKAKTLGLRAGLYDDYNWISGHAAGQTVKGYDHLREQHLFWTSAHIRGHTSVSTISDIRPLLIEGLGNSAGDWLYEDGEPRWGDWRLFKAFLCADDGRCSDTSPALDVTKYCRIEGAHDRGCRVSVSLPPNDYQGKKIVVFLSARCRSSRLINYLLPEAAKRFIEVGYEPYRRSLAEFFGDPLCFLFFDQPYSGFYTWKERSGIVYNSLMFDETLILAFWKEHRYPLEKALLALVLPPSPQSPRLRCDFFVTYGKLARESFLEPISCWTQENGLGLAGHELLSFVGDWGFSGGLPEFDARCNFGADYFAIDAYKTISSVDACNYHPQLSAIFGTSVAKAHGRKGCIVEQYTVPLDPALPAPIGQWDLTLDELRSQAIRHLFHGACQFLFHGFSQTDGVDGDFRLLKNPRFDFPPGINFEPWFEFHRSFANEIARLGTFFDSGVTLTDLAVLYPLRTYWDAGPEHPFAIESAFWNRWLSEHGYHFDIIDESQIFTNEERSDDQADFLKNYKVLILPGVSVVQDSIFVDVLEAYLESGGFVILTGPLPCASQNKGKDTELQERISSLFEINPHACRFHTFQNQPVDTQELEGLLEQIISKPVKFQHSGHSTLPLWTRVIRDGDDWKVAVFNDSLEKRRVTFSIGQTDLLPVLWDQTSGKQKRWGWFTWHGAGTDVFIFMEPKTVSCFRLSKAKRKTIPHIERITGHIENCQAYLNVNSNLSAFIKFHAAGEVKLEVSSSKKPSIQNTMVEKEVIPLSNRQWRLVFKRLALPPSISLDKAWRFQRTLESQPESIRVDNGWEKRYPAYSGAGYYGCHFSFPADGLAYEWDLIFQDVKTTVTAYLNDTCIGERGWPPYRLSLPRTRLKAGKNHLLLKICNTAGNAYYYQSPFKGSSPQPSGLLGSPILKPTIEVQLDA